MINSGPLKFTEYTIENTSVVNKSNSYILKLKGVFKTSSNDPGENPENWHV